MQRGMLGLEVRQHTAMGKRCKGRTEQRLRDGVAQSPACTHSGSVQARRPRVQDSSYPHSNPTYSDLGKRNHRHDARPGGQCKAVAECQQPSYKQPEPTACCRLTQPAGTADRENVPPRHVNLTRRFLSTVACHNYPKNRDPLHSRQQQRRTGEQKREKACGSLT